MTLGRWVTDFCQLHERAKQGALAPNEQTTYNMGREDLAATLLVAQRLALGGKAGARLSIRVTQAHPLELELGSTWSKLVTQDIAVGGLSTIVAVPPNKGDLVRFKLKMGREGAPLQGTGQVVYVEAQEGSAKIALRFEDLGAPDKARLEDAVFDAVVSQLRLLPKRV